MSKQIPVDGSARADEVERDGVHVVTDDLAYQRLAIVNVVYFGDPQRSDAPWVLIDAGVPGTASTIRHTAEQRFGPDRPPAAIVMTHGHFDHVGALEELASAWNCPVYAHPAEIPYLNGTASYPPPDPSVGGGMMAAMSPLYPRGPVDVSQWLQPLPADGRIPVMPDWRWVHTPGHTPGHVSLWRENDRVMIAGDAFITTNQESAYAVAIQKLEMHGPPAYYTQDWIAAEQSVKTLAQLRPQLVISGHGRAMEGATMLAALEQLARDFQSVAVPSTGRYVDHPARVDDPQSAYRET